MSSVVLIAHGTGAKREAVKEVRSMLKRKSNAMAEEREALQGKIEGLEARVGAAAVSEMPERAAVR